jgi:hypothetical protein
MSKRWITEVEAKELYPNVHKIFWTTSGYEKFKQMGEQLKLKVIDSR